MAKADPHLKPILVTGMPRSGTTWVATMLAATGRVVYINEPLNPEHPPGRSPGVLNAHVPTRFQYITEANEEGYAPAFSDLLALRYRTLLELEANHTPADIVRALRLKVRFAVGRAFSRQPLIADPFAVLSMAWFAQRVGCRVVVVVRRPEAVVSSRKRLGWTYDPRQLLTQPLLKAEVLNHLLSDHPQLFDQREGVIDLGSQLWAVLHLAVARLRSQVPEIILVRHEDLSLDPVSEFRNLACELRLPFHRRMEGAIRRATSARNPVQVDVDAPHRTRLDSRANLENWRTRLTPTEIVQIRRLTASAAQHFYPELPELVSSGHQS